MEKVSKLSASERARLLKWEDLMDWKPDREKPLTKEEHIAYSKKLLLGINKKSVGTKKKHKSAIITKKMDYFISIS